MSCIVIRKSSDIQYYFYRTKKEEEVRYLYGALSLLEGVEVISVSDIKSYKEYEPAIEIKSLAGLFIFAGILSKF